MNKVFKWPNNAACAVTLTYDDGLISQLDNAIPVLRAHGIKGTFFLSGAALTDAAQGLRWREAVKDGHEIGCHTIHHACDIKHKFVRKGFSLQDYSEQRMQDELEDNIRIINTLGYTAKEYVFAYPCGESALGPGMSQSYKPLVKKMFLAARAIKKEIISPENVDLYETPSIEAPDSSAGLIDLVKNAKKQNAWVIILFHGVGGDYIPLSKEAHEGLVTYLAKNSDSIYTDTFGSVAALLNSSR